MGALGDREFMAPSTPTGPSPGAVATLKAGPIEADTHSGAERRARLKRRRVVSQREGRKTCCRGSATYYARSRSIVTCDAREAPPILLHGTPGWAGRTRPGRS